MKPGVYSKTPFQDFSVAGCRRNQLNAKKSIREIAWLGGWVLAYQTSPSSFIHYLKRGARVADTISLLTEIKIDIVLSIEIR